MTTTLTEADVAGWTRRLIGYRSTDAERLNMIHAYLRDPESNPRDQMGNPNGPLRWLKPGVPDDVRRLAVMARVNMLKFVVDATTQVMYVDGYRAPSAADEEPPWETWQRNRLDARQIAVHRSALSYGASYVVVLPGTPVPVIRGASPRRMTAVYGDDEDWPELALEQRQSANRSVKLYRLYDAGGTWWVEVSDKEEVSVLRREEHDLGFVPIVRFVCTADDDGEVIGEVEPLIPLQDQINVTTFGLLVAQHYGAFRQRWIIGWTAPDEKELLKASAKTLWTFEDADEDGQQQVRVGEFSQTDLTGYINSREATLRHLATVSQTPAHELLGQLVNLSAEALAAAEANHRRKVLERQTTFGESWEQVLELAGRIGGGAPNPMASVRWRDTEARALSQTADALGKLVTMLGVPPQELWERIPGTSQQDIDRWKAAAKEADAIGQLNAILDRQSAPGNAGP